MLTEALGTTGRFDLESSTASVASEVLVATTAWSKSEPIRFCKAHVLASNLDLPILPLKSLVPLFAAAFHFQDVSIVAALRKRNGYKGEMLIDNVEQCEQKILKSRS